MTAARSFPRVTTLRYDSAAHASPRSSRRPHLTLPASVPAQFGAAVTIEALGPGPNGEDVHLAGIMFADDSGACRAATVAAGGIDDSPCMSPTTAVLTAAQTVTGTKTRLKWTAKGTVDVAMLGDLVNGDSGVAFQLDDSGSSAASLSVPSGGLCGKLTAPPRPCWKRTKSGFTYKSPAGPVQRVTIKGGPKGRIGVVAKGGSLPKLPLPFGQTPIVSMTMRAANACWTAAFSSPAKRNRETRFSDKAEDSRALVVRRAQCLSISSREKPTEFGLRPNLLILYE